MGKVKTQQNEKPDRSVVSQPPLTKPEFLQFLSKVTRPIRKPLPTDQENPKT